VGEVVRRQRSPGLNVLCTYKPNIGLIHKAKPYAYTFVGVGWMCARLARHHPTKNAYGLIAPL